MQFIENIKKLCSEVGTVMPAQTIDFFEDFEEDIFTDRNLDEKPIERDELGSWQYEISILLEVMDHAKFPIDTDIFQKMYKELGDWAKAIEDRNIILGIPKHKG